MMEAPLTPRSIARFWLPLAGTWLMMAAEGPFVAALIARLPAPATNLAAFGVALSLAMLFESPIIMMMSVSTALVRDRASYRSLGRFTASLNLAITVGLLVLLLPAVFHAIAVGLIGLPEDVAGAAHRATVLMAPWPAAIGYRRFYQGILIRSGRTRRVAYGTVVRLSSMAAVGTALAIHGHVPGAAVGGAALATGVVMEAAATRFMARPAMAQLPEGGAHLELGMISRLYSPLALTSVLTLAAQPMVTFFIGTSRRAIDSLAVLPVITTLVFLFRAPGIAYQEVVIALLGASEQRRETLRRFATALAAVLSGALALLVLTPARAAWLHGPAGLGADLVAIATVPLMLLTALPALEVVLSYERAHLVVSRRTAAVTVGTGLEIAVLVLMLLLGTRTLSLVGATAAATAILIGRLIAAGFLVFAATRIRRSH